MGQCFVSRQCAVRLGREGNRSQHSAHEGVGNFRAKAVREKSVDETLMSLMGLVSFNIRPMAMSEKARETEIPNLDSIRAERN